MSADKKKKNKRSPKETERKDCLIQTRITPTLYQQVVGRAEALRIPVSNLIRIVLEESDKLVGGVLDQSLNIAEVLAEGRAPTPRKADVSAYPPEEEMPVAWQPVIIGRRAVCGDCGQDLFPSEPAHMGLGSDGRPLLLTCPACFEARQKSLQENL